MVKALLKKQFMELNSFYFYNSKTGMLRSKKGIAGYSLLFLSVFIFLGLIFLGLGFTISDLLYTPNPWLYFGMIGLMAAMLGIFGSVFNTYASLYLAKDNELLLSMPIPPSTLLFVRMAATYAMSLLYTGIVWVPGVIIYWINGHVTFAGVISPVFLLFVLALLVTVLTCILGWGVAEISGKLKGKSFITVIISLIFFAAYYYVCMNMSNLMKQIMLQSEAIGRAIRGWLYPIYLLANGAEGKPLELLLFTLISAAAFALCYYVLSKRFISIVTKTHEQKEVKYTEKKVKAESSKNALFKRELKRFTSSATYMMNTGLGIVILPVVCIIAVVKMDMLREVISGFSEEAPLIMGLVPVFVVSLVCMTISMNCISAPSISLEGKSLWIIRSMPVSTWEVLHAKENLHVILNSVPAVVSAVVLGLVAGAEISTALIMAAAAWIYVWFTADFGLYMNLKRPNLTWTNETAPIKQSGSIMIVLFGGWIISVALAGAAVLLRKALGADAIICIFLAVMAIAYTVLNRWLKTKGIAVFEEL